MGLANREAADVASPGAIHHMGERVKLLQVTQESDTVSIGRCRWGRKRAEAITEARIRDQRAHAPRSCSRRMQRGSCIANPRISRLSASDMSNRLIDVPVRFDHFPKHCFIRKQVRPEQVYQREEVSRSKMNWRSRKKYRRLAVIADKAG